MARYFTAWLQRLLDEKYPDGLRSFIRAAEPDRSEDSGAAYLSKVLDEKKPPPLERIGQWADALGLQGPSRERFLILAEFAHGPERIESVYLDATRELEELRSAVAEARRRGLLPHRQEKKTRN